MKKYVCMKEDDDFCTSDEEDAYEHAHLGKGHLVIQIELNDTEASAHLLEIPELNLTEYEEEQ